MAMIDLSFAYLAAAGLIAVLFLLAKQNQKQGWRKPRAVWWQTRATEAIGAFKARAESPAQDEGLQHLGDLDRLRQSLVTHGEPTRPASAEVGKQDKRAPGVPSR